MNVTYDIDCTRLATFRVPAQAAALVSWHSEADLADIAADNALPRPLKVIGGGSNLLFTQKFDGTLLLRRGEGEIRIDGLNVSADGQCELDRLCELTCRADLRGLENLSKIPGTVGGAIVQNAGAYGAETADCLTHVELFDLEEKRPLTMTRSQLQPAYRTSALKHANGRYVVIRAHFTLRPGSAPAALDYGNLRATLGAEEPTPMAVRRAVIATRAAKLPDPTEIGSAGSFFRNPEVDRSLLTAEMPRYELENGLFKVPAAWLIDRCGLKGRRNGGAMVWPSQPLVIVNAEGKATAADILALESEIVDAVKSHFNITLHPEVEHL